MICVASSKHKSMRFARMWNSKSPGVETAWRAPARISWKGGRSGGRGRPKSRSHALDPNPMTQERPASMSRNSTARNRAARSAQSDRTVVQLFRPGFIVATRKIAALVSGAATSCAIPRVPPAGWSALIGSDSIRFSSSTGTAVFALRNTARRNITLICTKQTDRKAYHREPPNVHAAFERVERGKARVVAGKAGYHDRGNAGWDCSGRGNQLYCVMLSFL